MFSDNGYTLELATSEAAVGSHVPLQFRILDSVGAPLTRYTDTHDKQLHLIVVGLDLTRIPARASRIGRERKLACVSRFRSRGRLPSLR